MVAIIMLKDSNVPRGTYTHFQNVEMDTTPDVHAFNGRFIMTLKEKTKKAPYTKAELIKKIQSQDGRFEKPALLRINMTHLGYILDVLG
tara:strand:+ start:297 stop:563 length:267 start_codon:yes stop_codon:yes gene_type:complete